MNHQTIILCIVGIALFFTLFQFIKNKPQYLVLLGIRGLFTMLFIQFVNYLCSVVSLPSIIQANPLSIAGGSLLGIPGIILLYAAKIYLL